ncbi:PLP-dependent aminotransferase family protein [Pseudophaeobacter sp.]|uniref:aminotransferase-like domain-containing protein n=1 Tax=Pseudophaeobacter sp. TaxID=1971739 RepID=UPI003299F9BB
MPTHETSHAPSHTSRCAAAIPLNPLRALFPLVARDGMLSFANGHPSPDACDHVGLAHAVDCAKDDEMSWRYGPSIGDPDLRPQLAMLSDVEPDAIVVTSGSQQGIDIAVRSALNPDDCVAIPSACYPAVLSVLAANGQRPIAIAEDEHGVLPEALHDTISSSAVRALYLTPTFGNPTGRVMPRARRIALLEICAQHDVLVIEDDPYCDLWFETPPHDTFVALARVVNRNADVIALRSASKSVAPGLRVGWMVVPDRLRGAVAAIKQASDLQTSGLAQRTVFHYLSSGQFDAWLPQVRALYQERQTVMIDGLHSAGFAPTPVDGGMFSWVKLPSGVNPETLFSNAVKQNVLFAPGISFASDPTNQSLRHHIRLCFAAQGCAKIKQGCKRLGQALAESSEAQNHD